MAGGVPWLKAMEESKTNMHEHQSPHAPMTHLSNSFLSYQSLSVIRRHGHSLAHLFEGEGFAISFFVRQTNTANSIMIT